jgi:hypothetical protein
MKTAKTDLGAFLSLLSLLSLKSLLSLANLSVEAPGS